MATVEKRWTNQRQVILEELRRTTAHPTAEEVYDLARKRLPRISLGTVYRNLEDLADEGTVLKLDGSGPRRRFDGNVSRHYHIRCIRCGRVDDVTARLPAGIDSALRGKSEYRVLGHRVEFDGICPRCRRKHDRT
jgi:Fur family ferric uptake transcriptional regulator